jgi:hypothetical protein
MIVMSMTFSQCDSHVARKACGVKWLRHQNQTKRTVHVLAGGVIADQPWVPSEPGAAAFAVCGRRMPGTLTSGDAAVELHQRGCDLHLMSEHGPRSEWLSRASVHVVVVQPSVSNTISQR